MEREPCPDRILDDIGGAFSMGAFGGSAVHFINGMRNYPRGERFFGGSQAVRMYTAKTAGGFAVWGGLFSTFDCSMVYMRQKEDPWNSIIAGAATGGILQMRRSFRASGRSALMGGAFFAFVEGTNIMLDKSFSAARHGEPTFFDHLYGVAPQEEVAAAASSSSSFEGEPVFVDDLPSGAPVAASSSSWSSWFGGLFGGTKEEEKKTEILESFDSPTPPTFEFK